MGREFRAAVVAAVVAVIELAGPSAAGACSVAAPLPSMAERLRAADLAVYGEVLSAEPVGGDPPGAIPPDRLRYRLRVLQTFKGRSRRVIRLVGYTSDSMCGIELRVGQRTGLLLYGRRGPWEVGMLSTATRAELRRARRALRRRQGRG